MVWDKPFSEKKVSTYAVIFSLFFIISVLLTSAILEANIFEYRVYYCATHAFTYFTMSSNLPVRKVRAQTLEQRQPSCLAGCLVVLLPLTGSVGMSHFTYFGWPLTSTSASNAHKRLILLCLLWQASRYVAWPTPFYLLCWTSSMNQHFAWLKFEWKSHQYLFFDYLSKMLLSMWGTQRMFHF